MISSTTASPRRRSSFTTNSSMKQHSESPTSVAAKFVAPSAVARGVQFAEEQNRFFYIEKLDDLPKDEVDATWFSAVECDSMKSEASALATAFLAGYTDVETRGLESVMGDKIWKAYQARKAAYDAVLIEQEQQQRKRKVDPVAIAQLYATQSALSLAESVMQAKSDRTEAVSYLSSSPLPLSQLKKSAASTRRPSSSSSKQPVRRVSSSSSSTEFVSDIEKIARSCSKKLQSSTTPPPPPPPLSSTCMSPASSMMSPRSRQISHARMAPRKTTTTTTTTKKESTTTTPDSSAVPTPDSPKSSSTSKKVSVAAAAASPKESSSKPKKVRFGICTTYLEVLNWANLSPEEWSDLWFSSKECRTMKEAAAADCMAWENQDAAAAAADTNNTVEIRGLEAKTMEGKIQSYQAKKNSWEVVFREIQDRRRRRKKVDWERVSRLYNEATVNSREEAVARAKLDEQAAKSYQAEKVVKKSRRISTNSTKDKIKKKKTKKESSKKESSSSAEKPAGDVQMVVKVKKVKKAVPESGEKKDTASSSVSVASSSKPVRSVSISKPRAVSPCVVNRRSASVMSTPINRAPEAPPQKEGAYSVSKLRLSFESKVKIDLSDTKDAVVAPTVTTTTPRKTLTHADSKRSVTSSHSKSLSSSNHSKTALSSSSHHKKSSTMRKTIKTQKLLTKSVPTGSKSSTATTTAEPSPKKYLSLFSRTRKPSATLSVASCSTSSTTSSSMESDLAPVQTTMVVS